MRNLFLCLAMVLLSSCIPVDDFGTYWEKGTIDPALLGRWVEITSPARDADDRKEARTVKVSDKKEGIQVVNQGGTYRIDSLDEEERQKKDYAPMPARTLKAGCYTFLMVIDKERDDKSRISRDLVRYEIQGDVFRDYSLDDGRMSAFLEEKYPGAKNIGRPACKGNGKCLRFVRIGTLDDEVFKILSEIPDTKEFWTDAGIYRRQAGAAR